MKKKAYMIPAINMVAVDNSDQLMRANSITNTGDDDGNQPTIDDNGDDDFGAGAKGGWVGKKAWSEYDW